MVIKIEEEFEFFAEFIEAMSARSDLASFVSKADVKLRGNTLIIRTDFIGHSLLSKPDAIIALNDAVRSATNKNIKIEIKQNNSVQDEMQTSLLDSLGVKVSYCENTAVAAKIVAESGRDDLAALSSSACGALYGLDNLKSAAQNVGNNYTRFICVSRELEIYPGADRTTLMLETENRPGALYKLLARFYARGINLTSLVSKPIPEREFSFRFYFDLDTSVYSDSFAQLMCELDSLCPTFRYLGSYREMI